jgi:hypothetical protein
MTAPKGSKTQAISLLEGILQETQGEADAEMKRLAEDLRRKEEEAKLAAERAERAKREDAERRLAEEEARQQAAAERRAQELERMRIEELKAKGLWKEPEKPVEEAPAPVVSASVRPTMSTTEAMAIQKAQTRQARGMFAMAAVMILAIGGGIGGFVYANSLEYVDSTTPYAKTDAAVVTVADSMASLELRAIPAPPVIEAAPEDAAPTRARSSRPRASTPAQEGPRQIVLDRNRRAF